MTASSSWNKAIVDAIAEHVMQIPGVCFALNVTGLVSKGFTTINWSIATIYPYPMLFHQNIQPLKDRCQEKSGNTVYMVKGLLKYFLPIPRPSGDPRQSRELLVSKVLETHIQKLWIQFALLCHLGYSFFPR